MLTEDPLLASLPLAARLAMEQVLKREADLRHSVMAKIAEDLQRETGLRSTAERRATLAEQRVKLLEEEIRLLRIKKYGPKSEQLSDAQLQLLDLEPGVAAAEIDTEVAQAAADVVPRPPRRPHPGRHSFPEHLPRVIKEVVCTPEQCRCAQCGGERVVINHDVSQRVGVVPAKYFVEVTRREKRACPQCEEMGVTTAAAPLTIIEKGIATDELVVDVILKKYFEHLPLYRQEATMRREADVYISRMTLCGWVSQVGGFLQTVSRAMQEDLLSGGYIQADETTVGVQNQVPKGKNHQGYIWEYSRPDGPVVFDFQMSRGRAGPRAFLGSFAGILQCDAYSAYDHLGAKGIRYAGCWAHARREFVDALKLVPTDEGAREMIKLIGELYGIEKQAREQKLGPAERLALRQRESVPQLARIKARVDALQKSALPSSQLGKACAYVQNQWPRLELYAAHGEVEIDNNWCENAIRPLAIGRKNWLHIGSKEAGPEIAAIISVLETCRRLEINPRVYLLDVLPKLPSWPASRVGELTPANWLAARKAA